VTAILKVTGDWQKFKGLPAPAPMKVAEPKPDKRALFDAALKETEGEPALEATTPKKKAAPKKAADTAAEAPAEAAAADAAAETPAADAGSEEKAE
jgi:small subunit ribosomal protein S16